MASRRTPNVIIERRGELVATSVAADASSGTAGQRAQQRQDALLAIIEGRDSRLRARLARTGLAALSPLYGLGIRGYLGLYRRGILHRWRAPVPVVSVGNLSVGGTGKTEAVRLLAHHFQSCGLKPAILSYGYHGTGEAVRVVSDGRQVLMDPEQAGDEPVLLARALPGVPVLACPRRERSAELAVRELGANLLLLDDGFQYWRLERDLDLVLLDALRPPHRDALLPRGLLREPVSSLRRASGILITRCESAVPEQVDGLREWVARAAPGVPAWRASYRPERLRHLDGPDAGLRVASLRGLRAAALSAIGNPASFEALLRSLGCDVVPFRLPDHYRPAAGELGALAAAARQQGCQAIVTTEKDAVKLPALPACPLPFYALAVRLEIEPGFLEWCPSFQ